MIRKYFKLTWIKLSFRDVNINLLLLTRQGIRRPVTAHPEAWESILIWDYNYKNRN